MRGLKFVLAFGLGGDGESHPSRGAWIEIVPADVFPHPLEGRTPHGVRGLKFQGRENRPVCGGSHPSRGAWIEIAPASASQHYPASRTPHGVRGLKSANQGKIISWLGRTPHGVRGLKCELDGVGLHAVASHPSRGAWIEIAERPCGNRLVRVAPLTGCVD